MQTLNYELIIMNKQKYRTQYWVPNVAFQQNILQSCIYASCYIKIFTYYSNTIQ
jgi:hypothetical protein